MFQDHSAIFMFFLCLIGYVYSFCLPATRATTNKVTNYAQPTKNKQIMQDQKCQIMRQSKSNIIPTIAVLQLGNNEMENSLKLVCGLARTCIHSFT